MSNPNGYSAVWVLGGAVPLPRMPVLFFSMSGYHPHPVLRNQQKPWLNHLKLKLVTPSTPSFTWHLGSIQLCWPLLSPHLFVIPTRPPLPPLWIHRFLPRIFSKYSPRLCLLICHICTNNSQISILSQIFPLSNKLLYPTLGLSTISYPQYSQDRFRIVPLVAHCLCCPSWPCQSPFSQWMALLRRQNSGVLSGLSCYRYTYWCWLWTSLASIHIFDGVFVLYMCVLSLSTKIESSWRAVTLLRSCQALTPAHCQIPSRHSSKCLLIT